MWNDVEFLLVGEFPRTKQNECLTEQVRKETWEKDRAGYVNQGQLHPWTQATMFVANFDGHDRMCYWHTVRRGVGCCQRSNTAQDKSTRKEIIQSPNATSAEFEKPQSSEKDSK